MGQMTDAEKNALKRKIYGEMSQRSQKPISQVRQQVEQKVAMQRNERMLKAQNQQMPATLDPNGFHPGEKVYGSTGQYQDMQGGSHFTQYDCGHTYDDSVIRGQKNEALSRADRIRESLRNRDTMQNAVIMGEIMNRRGRRKRFT